MIAIIKKIMTGAKPVIVYSNYLKNGVFPIAKYLQQMSMPFSVYHGGLSEEQQSDIIKKYNYGMTDVLLITTAGGESLDLKNTRQIHIMEPHWNESKINQIIGRAIRYKSHATLPESERNVTIYKWISVFPPEIKDKIS